MVDRDAYDVYYMLRMPGRDRDILREFRQMLVIVDSIRTRFGSIRTSGSTREPTNEGLYEEHWPSDHGWTPPAKARLLFQFPEL